MYETSLPWTCVVSCRREVETVRDPNRCEADDSSAALGGGTGEHSMPPLFTAASAAVSTWIWKVARGMLLCWSHSRGTMRQPSNRQRV